MKVLVVTRGGRKVRLGPRGQTAEGVSTAPPMLDFFPWDVDAQNTMWTAVELSESRWKELIRGKEVYSQFRNFKAAIDYFERQPDYYFACPVTGKKYERYEDFVKDFERLKALVNEGES